MAEEATSAPEVDVQAVSSSDVSSDITFSPLRPAQPAAAVEPIVPQSDGDIIPKQDEETAGKEATTEVNPPDGEGTAEVAEPPSAATADGDVEATPTSGSKKDKRKSVGGVPEHKNKKLSKKKSMPTLHLDCKPGQFFWARLKGYPPWPAVICDEQMLPESLLASRPVSTTRPDGTLRDDFKDGGKNAKERTFPIMFLATNEFTWMVNTSLTPLDPEECHVIPNSKMTNALKQAWKIASENHDLDYFKNILKTWQEEQAQIEKELREQEEKEAAEKERKAQEAAEKAARGDEDKPKKKAKSRKSKGGDDDVDMEDADAPKSSKKRKNESDGDSAKPKKTPKVKLNAPKTPNGEASSAKKSSTKSKKKVVQAPKEDEEDEKPQMSEAEKLQQREKAVLYLRHRLQKGFLSRDQAPQESEMSAMADFFSQLEGYENLEPSIIRATKVHKVLKAIVKLASIPKDDLYSFKKRSAAMLEVWNKRMEAETESAPPSAIEPKGDAVEEKAEQTPETNGEKTLGTASVGGAADAAGERVVPVTEPKGEAEPKEDAQEMENIVTEAKAEVAAEELDEKVGATLEDKMEIVEELPAVPVEEPAAKIAPVSDAKDETAGGEAKMQPTVEEVAETA